MVNWIVEKTLSNASFNYIITLTILLLEESRVHQSTKELLLSIKSFSYRMMTSRAYLKHI
jgi:hypothetical protein